MQTHKLRISSAGSSRWGNITAIIASRRGGTHAVVAVLQGEAVGGLEAQRLGGLQIRFWMWLAPRIVPLRQHCMEAVAQTVRARMMVHI